MNNKEIDLIVERGYKSKSTTNAGVGQIFTKNHHNNIIEPHNKKY